MIENYSFDVVHANAKLFVNLTIFFHPAPVRSFPFVPVFASISNYHVLKKYFNN